MSTHPDSDEDAGKNPRYDPADPRIYFAAERTLLAWVRTGLAMMGFGFVVARFGLFLRMVAPVAAHHAAGDPTVGPSAYTGTALVALGVAVNLGAAVKHVLTLRRLRRGAPVWQDRISMEIVVAVLLAIIGAAMAAYLIRVI